MSICVAMVHAHEVKQGPRVCPRLMVVFNPNSVCLGSCILSSRIIRVSNFIGPRMCPRLMVALTQTLFIWAVCFILLDHEDKVVLTLADEHA